MIFCRLTNSAMPHNRIKRKVNKILITLYALMVMGLLGSLGFAMVQNWQLKIQSVKSDLARQAGVGNFIVSNAIVNASKSLSSAQRAMQQILNDSTLSALQAHEILQNSLHEFNAYSNSDYEGLLLLLDPNGELLARTDHYPAGRINFSDRFYFQQLLRHPQSERAIGPLLKARTTGEWVFHVSVPLRDSKGQLRGVLAQQIRAIDIARDLTKYVATNGNGLLVSQSPEAGKSFIYPLHQLPQSGVASVETPYADFARRSTSPQDAFVWPQTPDSTEEHGLVGYEHSYISGLLTTMYLPLSHVWFGFLQENIFLLVIAGTALLLISGIFLRLHRTSHQLTDALHDAYIDTLTQCPNRRAFDDMFPRLLRAAMRAQEPLSVLFIDIDRFKQFNDDYGHDGGDAALQAVARTLTSCATRPFDFVCRWGGEEFVVLLPNTQEDAAIHMAEKILSTVRAAPLFTAQGTPMRHVTVSIGIASSMVASVSLGQSLVNEADEAMQAAKRAGRDQWLAHPRLAM